MAVLDGEGLMKLNDRVWFRNFRVSFVDAVGLISNTAFMIGLHRR